VLTLSPSPPGTLIDPFTPNPKKTANPVAIQELECEETLVQSEAKQIRKEMIETEDIAHFKGVKT
jgi:hypothetical protein